MTGTSRATPALLWSRAALLATVVVVVSVLGHVSADGLLPGPLALVGLLLVTTVAGARFLTRQASTARLVGLLVGGQAVIHGALTFLAGHGAGHGAGRPPATRAPFVFDGHQVERTGSYFDQVAAMQHPAASAGSSGSAAGSGLAHVLDHIAGQSPTMLLAHLAVVALLGVWLAVGERALWSVLCLATARLVDVVAQVAALTQGQPGVLLERVRRVPSLGAVARDVVPLPHLLHHVVAHRGPPALLAS